MYQSARDPWSSNQDQSNPAQQISQNNNGWSDQVVQANQYNGLNQNYEQNIPLLNHISYVRSAQLRQQQYNQLEQTDLNYQARLLPNFYNFNVQENLPFKFDIIKIVDKYDASRPNVFKRCFLDPVCQDNQFQNGWAEFTLTQHPFMSRIQELCAELSHNIYVKLAFNVLLMILGNVVNLFTLMKIYTSDGSRTIKALGFLVSMIYVMISIMINLQMMTMIKSFGSPKRLGTLFAISFLIIMAYIPIIFFLNHVYAFLPFGMAFIGMFGIIFFSIINRKQIVINLELYLLINGRMM